MEKARHDLVVIGAGPGGYIAAIRAAQLGLNVGCVEKETALGGTCLRIGCIPSKALLDSSERYQEAVKHLADHGIECSGVSLNFGAMLKRKDQVVSTLTRGVESLFKKNKITRYAGTATLAGPGAVKLVAADQTATTLEARHIILATGSRPSSLPGVAFDGDRIASSTEALSFPEVPRHLVVIGAGYIGLELGSVWKRLGAEVTVLEYLNRILPGIDAEIAAEARTIFEQQGLKFRLGTKVKAARAEGARCLIESEGQENIECDRVLMAVGRRPNTEGLGLETIGVTVDSGGRIPVDNHFATAQAGVYAIGDCIAGPMLAHKAEEEGIACVEQIVTGYGHVNYETIPSVVYTQPEIGAVGKTEEQLQSEKIEYRKGSFPFRANARAQTLAALPGKVKILADAKTDRLLGVHILGPHAGDLINEAAVAMGFGASSEDLARSCHAHPTLGEALREAALAVDKRTINY
ncbi:MAG TPA: dihydrolipoyl dehydrogenase [Verrucomicrobiae bacterium]|nr:dihydrolipoyl dehydrogenase [Verrucomicrobiae bacterium]